MTHVKYAFYGSGGFAARCLELLSLWQPPLWIVTAPAKEAGRGRRLSATSVAAFAADRLEAVPLLESAAVFRDAAVLSRKEADPVDFSFVIDFGQMIREPILEWESAVGCLNIHPSLLPQYRGAAPVQRALMDGAAETGVTIFKLASGMDAGPILLQRRLAIEPEDDAGSLLERCARTGVSAFVDYASATPLAAWSFREQDESCVTYAAKISGDEERIDWGGPAGEIVGKIRALSPKPGAWTTVRGKRLRVMSASIWDGASPTLSPGELSDSARLPLVATGAGTVLLGLVQAEGKKIQDAAQWWNGFRAAKGEFLV